MPSARHRPEATVAPSVRRMVRVAWVAATLAAIAFPAGVGAQDRAAEDLMERAFRERSAGHFERALALFESAWQRTLSPRALAQRAITEQALGRWPAAYAHYRDALGAASDPWIAGHRAALEQALAVVRERVGLVDLRGGPADAEVRIDGEPVAVLPLPAPLPLEPGIRVLEIRALNRTPLRRAIAVIAAQVSVEPVPMQLGADPGAAGTPSSGRGVAWGVTAGAAVALVGGAVANVIWLDNEATYNSRCVTPALAVDPSCQRGGMYFEGYNTRATSSLVGMIAGYGAAFALGITAIVLHVRAGAPPPARAGVRCAPAPGPGVQCAVTF